LKWRLAVFTALAILTLAYRGMAVYTRYLSPDTATRATFAATYQDGAMVVTTTDSVCRWPDDQKHLCNLDTHPGDRLVEIHDCDGSGGAVTGLFRYGALLKPIGPEDAWTIVVDRPLVEGGFRRVSIELPPAVPIVWTLNQTLVNVGFDIVLPLLAMAVGLFVGFMRPKNNQAFLVALVFLGYSAAFFPNVAQFPPVWREIALLLRTAALTFSPYLILLFFLRFPRPSPIDRRVPWLSRALLPVTIAVFAIELTNQFTLHLSFAANYGFIETLGPVGLTQNVRGIFFSVYWVGAIALSLTSITLNAIRSTVPTVPRRGWCGRAWSRSPSFRRSSSTRWCGTRSSGFA
jgi:hypothetical protein